MHQFDPCSICTVLSVGCERVVLGKGAKVLISESAVYLSSTSWKKKLRARRMNRPIGGKMDS